MARGAYFDPDVDPEMLALLEQVAETYGPHAVELFSGRAARPKNPSSMHPRGGAIDVNLIDRNSKKALANIRDPSTGQAYQQFANSVYQAASPEMRERLRWGGYFKNGRWAKDWMHFDVGGANNMAGGSWEGGFTPEQMAELGYANAGGIGEMPQGIVAASQPTAAAGGGDPNAPSRFDFARATAPVPPLPTGDGTPNAPSSFDFTNAAKGAAGGGYGPGSPGAGAPAGGVDVAKRPEKSGWEKFGEMLGKGLGEGAFGGGGGLPGQEKTVTPGAALAPTASGGINPEEMQMRRQKLAEAMARLNSGKLW